jgi:hypothetical protein
VNTRYTLAGLIAVLFCLFLLAAMPVVQATTDHFSDSMVIIMGRCETVSSPALWLFGVKVLLNRHVYIQASGGEDEQVTALIFPSRVGFYFGQDDMTIQLDGATGVFFRGERSWLFPSSPQRVVAVCRARDISVTYL